MDLKENINSLLKAVGLKAVEVKLEQMLLDDGVTTFEADSFEAGQSVNIVTNDEQLIPVPVGEFTLEDGRVLVVTEEGVIAEVKEAATEETEESPMPAEAPVAASETAPATPKVITESIVKEMKFSKEEEFTALIAELKAEIELLKQPKVEEVDLSSQEPAAEPIKHNPESANTELSKVNTKSLTKKGRLTEFLNNK